MELLNITAKYIPTAPPPNFWKGAGCMLYKLSNASSLYDENQALFIAGFSQLGVPVGCLYNPVVINHPTYSTGDRDS
jgi:hypothetical protein